jgi:CHAD domain-containing protein
MTHLSHIVSLLPNAVGETRLGKSIGKLKARYDTREPQDFSVLDCFDQSIRSSGAILIEAGGELLLISDQGVLRQPSRWRGSYVADLEDGPVKAALGMVSPLRCVMELGFGQMRVSGFRLEDDERKTHLRGQIVELEADTGAAVTLVTGRALRGYGKAALRLSERLDQMGFAALDAGLPVLSSDPLYVAKPDIAMTGEESAFQAANDIIKAYIDVARLNEPGIMADLDTEFLHDYRVALRKIRSVLSLFKGVYSEDQTLALKTAFSDLMAPTGRMRDLDVYLLEKDHYFDLLPDQLHDGLTAMFDMFAKERNAQLAAMTERLQSDAYAQEVTALKKLFAKPRKLERGPNADLHAHDYACALIWKRYRKVCKIASGIDDSTHDDEVHELRIHCKKLRYLMEFFAPLFPKKDIKALIKPLKKLQDNLGLFNDYSVQQVSLQDFLEHHPKTAKKTDRAIASSIGALIAVLHGRQLEERARVVSSFAQFNSDDTRARFQTLFHASEGKA